MLNKNKELMKKRGQVTKLKNYNWQLKKSESDSDTEL